MGEQKIRARCFLCFHTKSHLPNRVQCDSIMKALCNDLFLFFHLAEPSKLLSCPPFCTFKIARSLCETGFCCEVKEEDNF